jgi:hypothetical protein
MLHAQFVGSASATNRVATSRLLRESSDPDRTPVWERFMDQMMHTGVLSRFTIHHRISHAFTGRSGSFHPDIVHQKRWGAMNDPAKVFTGTYVTVTVAFIVG